MSKLISVVLPQPVGPTMATRSPGFTDQVQILNEFLIRTVSKASHPLKAYISFHISQNFHILRFRCLRFFLDKFKDTTRTGDSILKLSDDAGNLIKRFRILICIAQEAGQLSDRHSAAHGCQCSRNSHTRVHKTVYKAGGRVGDRGKEDRPQRIFLKAAIDFIETGHIASCS